MIRQTIPRKLVEQALKRNLRPVSISTIYEEVRGTSPVAFSTVFRIIQRLEASGRVKRIDWRSRAAHYEWVATANHHHHLVCLGCGRVIDIDDESLALRFQTIEQTTGFQIHDHALELHGYCRDCQRLERKAYGAD